MIAYEEIKNISTEFGVPITYIEKDYVMSWLLWGIYNHSRLANNLILKGGNCLRKIYFPDTRFTDDLDFTAYRLDTENVFKQDLNLICQRVSEISGITFNTNETRVKEKSTPDKNCNALDGRVYFKGFAGDSSLNMRVKFDVSEYEKIVLPVQHHNIIHNFSDSEACSIKIKTYSLEEVLAEKLRSWIQRTRSRDLFDVVKIIQSDLIPISKKNILSTFFQKTIFKNVPLAGQEELLFEEKFNNVKSSWLKAVICPKKAIITAANAILLFKDFIKALFNPELLNAIGIKALSKINYHYKISSGVREAIIEAGKKRQMIRLRYSNKERDIEPYSFRYKTTQKGYGAEYFYGFDRTRGNTTKRFFLHKIQGISIMPIIFTPRWMVEF